MKTTIAGIATIVGAVCTYLVAFFNGHGQDVAVITAVLTAISTGIGLIKASDAPTQ